MAPFYRTSTPEHFGTGIYMVASLLNHSCVPNCTVVFQGRQLSIVATKDVPEGRFSLWTNDSKTIFDIF